jgi:protease-4
MDDQNPVPMGEAAPAGASAQKASAASATEPGWERRLLEKLALDTLEERRRARRWGIFFKLLGFGFVALTLLTMAGVWDFAATRKAVRHTALVDVQGVIEPEGDASAEAIIEALRSAFEDAKTAGVVLRINSPGGSPVQAGIIHDEIKRLRAKYPKTPIYAVVEEVCASGSYYLAVATERVYVDKASLVGSIGVLMDGFGFVDTMDKVGVERRLLTAGRNKAFLDPFSPLSEEHRKHAQTMLDEIHRQFIDIVKAGRGDRLKDAPELFSGLVWTGARSVELGLADELGTVGSVARDVIKAEDVVDYSVHESLTERFAKRVGASTGAALARAFSAAAGELRLR